MITFKLRKLCILIFLIFTNLGADSIESNLGYFNQNLESRFYKSIESNNLNSIKLVKLDSKTDSNNNLSPTHHPINDVDSIESKDTNNTQEKVTESKTKEQLKEEKKLQKLEQKQEKVAIKAQKKQAKIDRIDKRNNRRYIVSSGPFSIPLPFFYTQFGAGFMLGSSVSSAFGQNVNATFNSSAPNFGVALGFNQQIDIWILNIGFKVQMQYEVALKGIADNTNSFQFLGIHSSLYAGIYRFVAHFDCGYEMLYYTVRARADVNDISKGYVMAKGEDDGFSVGGGIGFIISKNSAIDLSYKTLIGNNQNISYNRVMFFYEFRF
ncbi:hypothetical protein DCO58_08270 [Helicobacter saguini]|uniref:Outer membrane protein beta-barrel domain-containing protein n=1 Tax=Helicobacter saguini TaxID=1548018 RepID=A0A347VNQ1_9HELI|nr:hypothetical protein [Helicobacter saguini]MWV61680.1 hypothetical protein [Helicobacter saguini]MWV67647.1 hypothetical protein [Helicobacter saguini]MWV69999.1 hypothetical protein [Helicobacter saguini]MWV72787.1 hypothetical protein [Helicobacter saguini]TLD92701.1 hypothetical protein LS64_009765 [Helicobacter saguini]